MTMSRLFREFEFETRDNRNSFASASDQVEEEHLKYFDEGYQAGWEDALKAQADGLQNISEELAQSLQEISFTYYEVRSSISDLVKEALAIIIEKIFPIVGQAGVRAQLVDRLEREIRTQTDTKVEICVSPGNKLKLENLISERLQGTFEISEDEAISDGQAFMRVGATEEHIDFDRVIREINEILEAHFSVTNKEHNNER